MDDAESAVSLRQRKAEERKRSSRAAMELAFSEAQLPRPPGKIKDPPAKTVRDYLEREDAYAGLRANPSFGRARRRLNAQLDSVLSAERRVPRTVRGLPPAAAHLIEAFCQRWLVPVGINLAGVDVYSWYLGDFAPGTETRALAAGSGWPERHAGGRRQKVSLAVNLQNSIDKFRAERQRYYDDNYSDEDVRSRPHVTHADFATHLGVSLRTVSNYYRQGRFR